LVTADVHADELAERLDVALQPPELLAFAWIGRTTIASTDRVDQHHIALVQRSVSVVLQSVRRSRKEPIRRKNHLAWSKRAHVQPHRRRAWTAIEGERHRPLAGVLVIERVSDEEHLRRNGTIQFLDRQSSRGRGVAKHLADQGTGWFH